MTDASTLPRLAALYLTTGHRVPPEVTTLLDAAPAAPDAAAASTVPPGGWELPLDGTRQYGEEPGTTILRIRPPAY